MDLGKFHHDLTVRPNPGNHGLDIGESSPFMAELFRLVNYYNLPRHGLFFVIRVRMGNLYVNQDFHEMACKLGECFLFSFPQFERQHSNWLLFLGGAKAIVTHCDGVQIQVT